MPTASSKAKLNVDIDPTLKRDVIVAMRKGETLTAFTEGALRAEIERRRHMPPPAEEVPKLPRGRRPKP